LAPGRGSTILAALLLLAAIALSACGRARATGPIETVSSTAVLLSDADVQTLALLLEAADTRRADTTGIDQALSATTPFVRAFAARTVGQIGISARAARLRALVADPDSMIAADAAFSLGLLRDSAGVGALASGLARQPTVIAAAAWSLGELGESARSAIEQVLRTGQPKAAVSDVLQAAAKLRPVPATLVTAYLLDPDVAIRRSAAYAVTRSRVPSATTALLALATRVLTVGEPGSGSTDTDIDLRSYIARGLSKPVVDDSLAAAARSALERLADDVHPHVRINAIRSLATYGADARAALIRHLDDPDANARIALAQSLGGVLPASSVDWIDAWRADTGFTYRRALLAAAFRAGARLPVIDSAAASAWQRSSDWRYRSAAAEAVAGGSAADIDAVVVPLLRDTDGRVRTTAFRTAAVWADSTEAASKPYGRSSLRSALADSDLFVRATILDALRSRARAADAWMALAAWRHAARDPENDARLAALRVIAAAWKSDSASFGALRDSLRALKPPADPLERDAARPIGALEHWPRSGGAPRERSWYIDQVRAYVAHELSGHPIRATLTTTRGNVRVLLRGADAPLTVANFALLARRGYYTGLAFHRVVPNFVTQDGDPRGDGSGGPGYAIRDELNRRWYDRGAVGMALSGPDTGGSQYFLTHSPQPHLDGHYTVFGHVIAGFDVLDALVQGDRILTVTID
jgi:cyclophilin family peptidyl-prolyl cis-trans isomerase